MSLAAQDATDVKGYTDPVHVMKYAAAVARKVVGSATACIVAIENSDLIAANLGDSGFMVVRPSKDNKSVKLIMKSEEQQHQFNFPYQLGSSSSDRPDDADLYRLSVEDGDLIILGTDGLFDNIDEKYICKLVANVVAATQGDFKLAQLARLIADEAFKVSQNPNAKTPFQIASRNYFIGGKPDDITVLVSRVRSSPKTTSDKQNTTKTADGESTQPKESDSKSQTTNKLSTASEDSDALLKTSAASNEEVECVQVAQMSLLERVFGLRPWTLTPARL